MKFSFAPPVALIAGLAIAGAANAQESAGTSSATIPGAPVTEGAPPSGYAWGGAWISNHYQGGYAGAVKALNAENSLYESGFAIRGDINVGEYGYNTSGLTDHEVGLVDADLMLGYRSSTEGGTLSAYVGVAYVDHDNSDPTAPLRGSETGLAVALEYQHTPNTQTEIQLQARYASPFETWSGSGRILWDVSDRFSIGPEVALSNNRDYSEVTIGPHLRVRAGAGELGFSAGYRHPTRTEDDDGYYASAYFALPIG